MRNLMTFKDFENHPFRILDEIEKDMRSMLDFMSTSRGNTMSFNNSPLCDLRDSDSHFLLSFDLPGMNREDIKVEVKGGRITVSGERKQDVKDGDYTEKRYGRFERSISLPQGVDEDKIEAHYENGVLSLALPKSESVKPRQIAIGSEKKEGIWSRLLGGRKDDIDSTAKVENKSGKAA